MATTFHALPADAVPAGLARGQETRDDESISAAAVFGSVPGANPDPTETPTSGGAAGFGPYYGGCCGEPTVAPTGKRTFEEMKTVAAHEKLMRKEEADRDLLAKLPTQKEFFERTMLPEPWHNTVHVTITLEQLQSKSGWIAGGAVWTDEFVYHLIEADNTSSMGNGFAIVKLLRNPVSYLA